MKTHRLLAVAAMLVPVPFAFAQDEILPTELPPAVHRTLDRTTGGMPIRKIISQIEESGRKVYAYDFTGIR